MATRTLPGLGLTGGFTEGEDGWGDAMNANLLKMSAIGGGTILARVAALPVTPAPAQGDIYILTTDDTVQVYDNAGWTAYAPSEGWMVYDRGADIFIQYDGTDWVEVETGGGGGGDYPLPDPTGKGGKIVAAKADGTGYELVTDQVGTGGGGGGGAGKSRTLASARITFADPANPVVATGHNVSSVVKIAGRTGEYRVNFFTPIDPTKAGFSANGSFLNGFDSAVSPTVGINRRGASGLLADHVDIVTRYSENNALINMDNWISFEVYDASIPARDGGSGGSGFGFSPPAINTFLLASGDATNLTLTADADVGLIVDGGASPASDILRTATIAIPDKTKAWKATARIVGTIAGANYASYGMIMRDTVGGKSIKFKQTEVAATLTISRWNGLTAYDNNISQASKANGTWTGWMRIRYEPSEGYVYFETSGDGKVWNVTDYYTFAQMVIANPFDRVGLVAHNNRGGRWGAVKFSVPYWLFEQ